MIPVLMLTSTILEGLVPVAAIKLQEPHVLKRLMFPMSDPVDNLPPLMAFYSI